MRRLTTLVLLVALAGAGVRADERILDWHSAVRVQADSTLDVIETIRVRAEGTQIRRGLLRDFPTKYVDRRGRRVVTGFEVLSVKRDGRPEPYAIERLSNGVRIRIGQEDVYLDRGEHSYAITYRTDRQLGFFDDHDELYWNVTGNGWGFPIDAASADVYLPGSVPASAITAEAYTGPQGARGSDWRAETGSSSASFRTTRGLAPREGLTIVVSWPKGLVSPPGPQRRLSYALRDAWPAAVALGGLLLLMAYYLRAWRAVGRDPPARTVVPRYQPPADQSPASMRYLRRMRYDDRAFAAALLSLAVQGGLRIEQASAGILGRKRRFTLHRTEPPANARFAGDETTLRDRLFATRTSVELDDENHKLVNEAKQAHRKWLERRFTPSLFRINGAWHAAGVGLSLLLGGLAIAWPAFGGGFGPGWWFGTPGGWVAIGAAVAALASNVVFGRLLKAPTVAGRSVMDEIEGFRLYLDVAEGDELKLVDAPRLTVSLFERYLPAALALDVEQRWAERFAAVFATVGAAHSPDWYSGDRWNAHDVTRFTSDLGGSFSSAVTSASTPPGSSSGSGSGGSSGGGGGGGGGGGW